MVSLQTLFPNPNPNPNPNPSLITEEPEISNSKKRKWDDFEAETLERLSAPHQPKQWKNPKITSFSHKIELHLETPLPSGCQRCLDIQSREVYLYNTRMEKTRVRNPEAETPSPKPKHQDNNCDMSLELELKLNSNSSSLSSPPSSEKMPVNSLPNQKNAFKEMETEMVAMVCMRCHMLVMLCKSSPTCPNCKFLHSLQPYA